MPDEESVPDVYTDQFLITSGIWGVAMTFLKSPPHPSPGQAPQPDPQATVRRIIQTIHADTHAWCEARPLTNASSTWYAPSLAIRCSS